MEKTYSLVDIRLTYQAIVEENKTLIREIIHRGLTKMKSTRTEKILKSLNNLLVAKQNRAIQLVEYRKAEPPSLKCLWHNMKTMKRT